MEPAFTSFLRSPLAWAVLPILSVIILISAFLYRKDVARGMQPDAATSFTEREPFEQGFSAYYETKMREAMNRVRLRRQHAITGWRRSSLFGLCLMTLVPILLLGYSSFPNNFFLSIVGALFFLAVISLWSSGGISFEFSSDFQRELVQGVLNFFGTFSPLAEAIPQDVTQSAILFPGQYGDFWINAENASIGTQQGRHIFFVPWLEARARIPYRKHSNAWIGGIFVSILAESFPDTDLVFYTYDDLFGLGEHFGNLQRVELESVEFEQRIGVFANDQVNARIIFSPDVMADLLDIPKLFQTTTIRGSVKNGHLNFFLPYATLIPAGTHSIQIASENEERIHQLVKQIHSILSLAEKFNVRKK